LTCSPSLAREIQLLSGFVGAALENIAAILLPKESFGYDRKGE
jgi:hypothetical protein